MSGSTSLNHQVITLGHVDQPSVSFCDIHLWAKGQFFVWYVALGFMTLRNGIAASTIVSLWVTCHRFPSQRTCNAMVWCFFIASLKNLFKNSGVAGEFSEQDVRVTSHVFCRQHAQMIADLWYRCVLRRATLASLPKNWHREYYMLNFMYSLRSKS